MAKSHSFSSENCLTWRAVMSCSASALRSSGLSGAWSIGSSSPSTRIVGGRPTFRCRSDAFRRTISCKTFLKWSAPCDGDATGAVGPLACTGLAIGIDPEQDLSVFDRLRVLDENLTNDPRVIGFDLVHDFHRLDDADDLPL